MQISVDVQPSDLAHELAFEMNDSSLLAFILEIDRKRVDLQFTERLYAALGDAIRKELEDDAID